MPNTSNYSHHTGAVSSRLARQEQKKVVRQTIWLGVGAVVLLGAFVFLVIPGLIRSLNWFLGSDTALDAQDSIPPQVPILSAPASATNSAEISIKGFGEATSELVVLVNSQEAKRLTIGDDGSFEFELPLTQGENVLSTYAIDANKNESSESTPQKIVFDSKAPVIEVEEPKEGQQFELKKNQQITVKGITEPSSRLMLNGRTTYASGDGSFSLVYQLQEGENKLEFESQDEAGNISKSVMTVNFKL
jgi:hypothetical protein